MTPRLERAGLVTAVAAGLVLCVLSAVLTVTESASSLPALEALARAAMVGVPIAVGVYALGEPPFAALRHAADRRRRRAGSWPRCPASRRTRCSTASAASRAGWSRSRCCTWCWRSRPAGCPGACDRAPGLARAAVVVLTLYLPTALLVEQYPVPSPWTVCDDDCPDNAFMVADIRAGVRRRRRAAAARAAHVALFAAVTVRLASRIRGREHLTRRDAHARARGRAASAASPSPLSRRPPHRARLAASSTSLVWMLALAVPAARRSRSWSALARWRLFVAGAMQRLAARRARASRAGRPARARSPTRSTTRGSRSSTGSRAAAGTGRTPTGGRSPRRAPALGPLPHGRPRRRSAGGRRSSTTPRCATSRRSSTPRRRTR